MAPQRLQPRARGTAGAKDPPCRRSQKPHGKSLVELCPRNASYTCQFLGGPAWGKAWQATRAAMICAPQVFWTQVSEDQEWAWAGDCRQLCCLAGCHPLPGLGFCLNCHLRLITPGTQLLRSLPSPSHPSNEAWHCLPPTLWSWGPASMIACQAFEAYPQWHEHPQLPGLSELRAAFG